MAKIAARNARILFDNRNLSPDVNNAVLSITAEAPEATGFCDTYRVRLNNSIRDYEFTCDGFYNDAASTMDEVLSAALAGSGLAAIYFRGLGSSNMGREFNSILASYEQTYAVADAAAVSFTLSGSSTLYHMQSLSGSNLGVCGAPYVKGVGSSTFASVDTGATPAATDSYVSVRVIGASGTTPTFSASIEYSDDDATFTTVASVIDVTPADINANSASMWHVTAASRYRRAIVSLGGTNPCAIFVIASGSLVA